MEIYILSEAKEQKLRNYIEEFSGVLLAQQTLEWRDALLEMGTDKAYYIVAEDNSEIVGYMPLFLYSHKLGNILQSSPYPASYGGIVTYLEGIKKEELYGRIFEFIFSQQILIKDVILFTIVTGPFQNDIGLYKIFFKYDYIKKNHYQYVNLEKDFELNQNTKFVRRNLRRNIKKAEQNQLIIEHSSNMHDIRKWYEIVKENFNYKGIELIPLSYYSALARNLFPKQKGELIHVIKDKQIIASGLYLFNNRVVDIFLRAVKPEFYETQAGVFCDYKALIYFKKNNFRFWNWQSSPKDDNGTYHYKVGWGSKVDYHYYLTKKLNNFESFRIKNIEEIKLAYKYHYIMPYENIVYED